MFATTIGLFGSAVWYGCSSPGTGKAALSDSGSPGGTNRDGSDPKADGSAKDSPSTGVGGNAGGMGGGSGLDPKGTGGGGGNTTVADATGEGAGSSTRLDAKPRGPFTSHCDVPAPAGSPVAMHGQLKVVGNQVLDEAGDPVQLRGISSMWLNWGGKPYVINKSSLQFMRDEWKAKVVRVSMGIEVGGGYFANRGGTQSTVETIVSNAIELGLYVLVDWHTELAVKQQSDSVAFFSEMAKKFGACANVIWEDYNEPNGFSWAEIKPYHEAVVKAIRAVDPDNLIVLGTPKWSQEVDIATEDPVVGTNLVYTLHWYSCSHKAELREKADKALARGFALFVTEFGATHADGGTPANAGVCADEANLWFDWMAKNAIGGAAWKLVPGGDSSCILSNSPPAGGPWPDSNVTGNPGSSQGHGSLIVGWVKGK